MSAATAAGHTWVPLDSRIGFSIIQFMLSRDGTRLVIESKPVTDQ
jgi:hypothetical protein